jgi:hypothetical protein
MKQTIGIIVFFFIALPACFSQDAQSYFNASADHYVAGDNGKAVQSVGEGLRKYPSDTKLRALSEKLKEEKKQQDKKDQEQKEQEKKEQEKKDQEKKEQEKKEQEKKDQEKKDEEKKDQENKDEKDEKESKEEKEKKEKEQQEQNKEDKDKNDDQKNQKNFNKAKLPQMTQEKAEMILEAMKNQEKQYLQQNKRKATKQKDRTKPDW